MTLQRMIFTVLGCVFLWSWTNAGEPALFFYGIFTDGALRDLIYARAMEDSADFKHVEAGNIRSYDNVVSSAAIADYHLELTIHMLKDKEQKLINLTNQAVSYCEANPDKLRGFIIRYDSTRWDTIPKLDERNTVWSNW